MNNDDLVRAIGVDLGGSAIKSGLVSREGIINGFSRVEIDRMAGSDHLLEQIRNEIERLTSLAGERGFEAVGVGVGSPGSIERSTGRIHKSPNFRGWDDFPLRDRLAKMTPLPVWLANDVNAAAMGELKFGAGEDFRNFIMITLGTGVGGALVVNGCLYDGARASPARSATWSWRRTVPSAPAAITAVWNSTWAPRRSSGGQLTCWRRPTSKASSMRAIPTN